MSSILEALDNLPARLEAQALENLQEGLELLLSETRAALDGPRFADLRASLTIELDAAGLTGRLISSAGYANAVEQSTHLFAEIYSRVKPQLDEILSRPPAPE